MTAPDPRPYRLEVCAPSGLWCLEAIPATEAKGVEWFQLTIAAVPRLRVRLLDGARNPVRLYMPECA